MKSNIRHVVFNTGKYGARFFNFNPFKFGWWYLHRSESGKTVGVVRLSYFLDEGVQFETQNDVLTAEWDFYNQRKSILKVVKE